MENDFIGKGWGFPPQFNIETNDINMVSDKQEIEESLTILFSTSLNERIFHPTFGCDLKEFQFTSLSHATILKIKNLIEYTVRQFEPRIELNSVDINLDSIYDGKIIINLSYTIKNSFVVENMVYSYYFE